MGKNLLGVIDFWAAGTRDYLLSAMLPGVLFLLGPIVSYQGNETEFSSSFVAIIWPFLIAFAVSWLGIFLSLRFSSRIRGLSTFITICILTFSTGLWLQLVLLHWNFGMLDGSVGNPFNLPVAVAVEVVIWILLASFATTVVVKKWMQVAKYWFVFLAVAVGAGAAVSVIQISLSGETAITSDTEDIEIGRDFSFSKAGNTLVIVLDTFQNDVFGAIAQEHPNEVQAFQGFTYFPNAMGEYPTTKFSIPLMLGAPTYTNERPYSKEFQLMRNSSVIPILAESRGEQTVGDFSEVALPNQLDSNSFSPLARDYSFLGISHDALRLWDLTLLKELPTKLKNKIYQSGSWSFSRLGGTGLPEPHGADLLFTNSFTEFANVSSTSTQPTFKFVHLMGAHWPVGVDENFQKSTVEYGDTDGYQDQARGALSLVRRMLERLQELGIYSQTQIIVTGDHGAGLMPLDMGLSVKDTFSSTIGSARPLMLIKPFGATGDLLSSNAPLSIADYPCVLGYVQGDACSEYVNAVNGVVREREYFQYSWSHSNWRTPYGPEMRKYIVNGDVRDIANWVDTGLIFKEGTSIDGFLVGENEYLPFGSGMTGQRVLGRGWSAPEESRVWSLGMESSISLRPNGFTPTELVLRGTTREVKTLGSLVVTVTVAGQELYRFSPTGNFEERVPLSGQIVDGQTNRIILSIGNENSSEHRSVALESLELR